VCTKLLGGRAKAAAKYLPELVLAIVRGLQVQREADARAKGDKLPYGEALVQAMSEDRAAWGDKVVLMGTRANLWSPSRSAKERKRTCGTSNPSRFGAKVQGCMEESSGHEVGLQQEVWRAEPGEALPTAVPGGQDVSDGGLLRSHHSP
jgi:hypothetical protein